ncbi:MAG: T9SS type A sorting domain-containing protein, partial [Candidatus Electryoneaceae bacterium]|nr:T9SS type A sorting domain-containing protein [Candidatus Electryoneaceae bacterium]
NLAETGQMKIFLYDLTGRKVLTLADGRFTTGQHRISIDADRLPSGVYLMVAEAMGQSLNRKVVLVR